MRKNNDTNLKLGIINLGNVVIREDIIEKEMQPEFDKKVSMLHPRLNAYTNTLVYNIEGMDFYIKTVFFNDDIKSVHLSPAEKIYDHDELDMNKYYEYSQRLKDWAVNLLGDNYVKISSRLFWRFTWGTISIPDTDYSFTGEMLQIEYGVG